MAPAGQQVEALHTQEQVVLVLVVVACTEVVDIPSAPGLVAEPAEEVCTASAVQVLVSVLEEHGKE